MNSIRSYEVGQSYYSSEGNLANDMRRDNDTVKVPKITLYDVDYSIFYHLSENFKPQLIENSNRIQVPVMFANGEKWSQIRQHGYLRDNNRKILAPLITIRRLDIVPDDRIQLPTTQLGRYNFQSTYRMIPMKSNSMQYDRVAGQYVSKDLYEFYMVDFPNYVRINYELLIWTDLQEQMNILTQGIFAMNGHMWGDYHAFRSVLSSVSHESVNIPGEDRVVKTTINLQVDAFLRDEYEYQQSTIQKSYSIKRVEFLNETDDEILFNTPNDILLPSNTSLSDNRNTELNRKIRT